MNKASQEQNLCSEELKGLKLFASVLTIRQCMRHRFLSETLKNVQKRVLSIIPLLIKYQDELTNTSPVTLGARRMLKKHLLPK